MLIIQFFFWIAFAALFFSYGGYALMLITNHRAAPNKSEVNQGSSHSFTGKPIHPFLIIFMFIINMPLTLSHHIYLLTMSLQFWFYAAAFAGYVLKEKHVKTLAFYLPYCFCAHNYAILQKVVRQKDWQAATLNATNEMTAKAA